MELAERHKRISVPQRAEKLLRLIEKRTAEPGGQVTLNREVDFLFVDAIEPAGLTFFLNYWKELGCIHTSEKQQKIIA